MQIEATTLFNQNQISQQLGYQQYFGLETSANVTLKTEEGDVVSFSFEDTFEYSESGRQNQFEGEEKLQELSISALAAFQYSVSVQGDLNEEELAATQSLTEALKPVASSFFTADGFDFEAAAQALSGSLSVIQELEVNLEKTVSIYELALSWEEEVDPEQLKQHSGNMENLEVSLGSIRDLNVLVESVINSVFRLLERDFPEDTLLDTFSDFKNFLTQQVLRILKPELRLETEAASPDEASSGSTDTQNPDTYFETSDF